MNDLIDRYHELLTPEIAEETHAHIEAGLTRRGLIFGGRPLCTVLRPRLTTPREVASLQGRIRPLMRAMKRTYAHAIAHRDFRDQFGLLDWEETLLADAPGYDWPSPTSRLDFFYVPGTGQLGLTEYNAETPAGAAYNDALTETFLDTPAVRELSRSFEIMTLPSLPGVVGSIMAAWHEFSGTRNRPRIAILDWDDVPTRTEFELYREHFTRLGLETVIDDPRRCEYRGGKLWVAGKPADLIYKRVLISELIETCGLEHDVVRAVRDRAVCLVDGFRCKILHKKASLAVLSDEANAGLFPPDELEAIHDCIPWTRVVRERMTSYNGATIDLVPWMATEREHLVLKPNDEYGGKGITLGWTVTDAEWAAAIADALAQPFIVQRKVAIPSEPYPSWSDGRLHIMDRMLDTAPFVSHGDFMEGILTRLSTAALLNVTAGGGSTVPTLVVQPR
ncbi:MAG: hypothetical protein IT360_10020 [Gemmatimonadaceae bacterium]|nr:hypothetical protein [Gemmatimonadaceae bacterium]